MADNPLSVVFLPSDSIIVSKTELFPSRNIFICNAAIYNNIFKHNLPFYHHMKRDIYVNRDCKIESVSLLKYPYWTSILGNGHFSLMYENVLVSEHHPVYLPRDSNFITQVVSSRRQSVDVENEAIAVARFGIFTWGHWLGELLPKVVVAEHFYPGRFSYALPECVVDNNSEELPWIRIRESMSSYGVGVDRIVALRPETDYRFHNLYGISSVWSDHMLHPEVSNTMRKNLRIARRYSDAKKIAVRRIGAYGRNLDNFEEIAVILREYGFIDISVGRTSFADQVRTFGGAEFVFGVLGSDLTNLIYSPDNVRVVAVAPENFGDRFFYALVASRNGQMIDLRGPVTQHNASVFHKASFYIDTSEIVESLKMLQLKPVTSNS